MRHCCNRTLCAAFCMFIVGVILVAAWWTFRQPHSVSRSEIREALDFYTRARAYPAGTIPASGIAPAFAAMQLQLQKQSRRADMPAPWRPLGPRNIGGRTLALAINPVNPKTIYAGSASGGLWRSFTAGVGDSAWHYVATGFPVLGVAAIAIAPDDTNTIYIGTGEMYGSQESFPGVAIRTTRGSYGIGILKTTDGGRTWKKSLDWFYAERRGVQKIRINPLNAHTVWAATTEGIYKSTAAGASWQPVLEVPMGTDIAIDPVDTATVFVACGGMGSLDHGIYRTMDGGATWKKMNLGPGGPQVYFGKAMLAMAPSNPKIVMASISNSDGLNTPSRTWLVRTVDGGETWRVVSTVDYASIQGWYSHDVAINPENPNVVWTGGQPFDVLLSTSGGNNLQPASALNFLKPATGKESLEYPDLHQWADYHEIIFHPTDPNIMYFANDGGIFRTTDGGRTLENCNGGFQTTQFYNGTSSSPLDSLYFIGGMQDNMSAAYEGSLFWRRIGLTADGSWTAMSGANDSTIFLSYQRALILRYHNRGTLGRNKGIIVTPPGRASPNFIAPFVLSPADNRTLYVGSTVIHKSTDEGTSWQVVYGGRPLDGNPMLSMAASHQSADVVYVASTPLTGRMHVFRTTDGGESWQDITGNLPDRFPTDLAVDRNNDRHVVLTLGGFGSSHVFQSEDGGQSWQDIGIGLPDLPTWAAAIDPDFPDHLYIGNDLGVYASTDGGTSWMPYTEGLPDAVIAMDLSISPANRALRVATHGNGVYERKLIGESATSIADGSALPPGFDLAQNYPNPFNPSTRIRFALARPADVALVVFDLQGRRIRTLFEQRMPAGVDEVIWDGRDDSGRAVSSGVYFVRMQIDGALTQTRKMNLVR